MINIAVVNQSTVCTDDELRPMVAAVQRQVTEHWAPAWGIPAELTYFAQGTQPPPGCWWMGIFDTSDEAGALGYHDLTNEGLPLGKVFAKTDKDGGYAVSVTLSHEILEMLGDPDINLVAEVELDTGVSRLYAYEVCDAVEADKLGYEIDGVQVSDFVLPAYFESFRKTGPFAYRTTLEAPFSLAPGGYMSYKDEGSPKGWQQEFAETTLADSTHALSRLYLSQPRLGSRRERRRKTRDNWFISVAATGDASRGESMTARPSQP